MALYDQSISSLFRQVSPFHKPKIIRAKKAHLNHNYSPSTRGIKNDFFIQFIQRQSPNVNKIVCIVDKPLPSSRNFNYEVIHPHTEAHREAQTSPAELDSSCSETLNLLTKQ